MLFYIYSILGFLCMHFLTKMRILIKEPFQGLFTQGMVCHETYKDKNNNWISPEEVVVIDGKKFLKADKTQEIKVGPSESCLNQRKIQLTLRK